MGLAKYTAIKSRLITSHLCSDDEDSSWKVRRAAAGALAAVFRAYPTVIVALYARCAGRLVSRFREREESVKLEVFKSFSALIAQVCVLDGCV